MSTPARVPSPAEPFQPPPPERSPWRAALAPAIAAGAVALPVLGWLASGAGRLPFSVARLELAPLLAAVHAGPGTAELLERCASSGALGVLELALDWDYGFIAGYAALLGGLVLWLAPPGVRPWPRLAAVGAAAVLDVLENLWLLQAVRGYAPARPLEVDGGAAAWACAAACFKFLLLAVVAWWVVRWWRRDLCGDRPATWRETRHEIADAFGDFRRAAGPIWLNLGVVFGLGAAFVRVPQAQDVIRRVGEQLASAAAAHAGWHAVLFLLGTALWGWTSWFWARFLLTARFDDERVVTDPRVLWFVAWIPRLAAFAAFAGVAAALWTGTFDGLVRTRVWDGTWRHELLALGLVQLLVGAVALFLLAQRRKLLERSALARSALGATLGLGVTSTPAHGPKQVDVSRLLGLGATRLAIGVSVGLAVALLAGFLARPVGMAGVFQSSATLLMLAGCAWIPVASLLAAFGRWRRVAVFKWLAALVIVFSFVNDNHRLPSAGGAGPARPTLAHRLEVWLHRVHAEVPGETRHRLYLVATEGGGIRAAYWTAGVLGRLETASGGDFSRHLFAISAVSGGNLGAAVFAAERAGGVAPVEGEARARAVLGEDLLSPVLGSLLFPEVLQKALPFPLPADRARALERSWEDAWAAHAPGGEAGRLRAPFLELFGPADAPDPRVPVLLLNATRVESGTRVIVTNVGTTAGAWPDGGARKLFPDATDAFELSAPGLPLSTAAHLGARFPYVSPAATFDGGHVVDGGYFDNSGAATLQDLLVALRGFGDDEPGHTVEPYVLVITNGDSTEGKPAPIPELLAPVQALLRARSARSVYAVGSLREAVDGADGPRCLQLGVRERDVPLPLGWMLSDLAKERLDLELDGVGWADGVPTCRGHAGRSAAVPGELECACDRLYTRFAGDAEPTSRAAPPAPAVPRASVPGTEAP